MKSISLIIKPTDACNLRCKHCYAADVGYAVEQMSIDTVKNIYNLFSKEYNEIHITWHGGEPLLMGLDFYQQALVLQNEYPSTKFVNNIQSNATLLTDDWVNFFIKNNIRLGISFDGQCNDVLRDKTAQVLRAINLMKSMNFEFGAICVICGKTADKLIDIYEFFKCIGVSYKINPIFISSEVKKHLGLELSTKQYIKEFIKFFEYWLSDGMCNINVGGPLDYVAQFLGKRDTMCTHTSCLTKWLGIHSNGDIFPCGRVYPEEYNMGNINNFVSPKDIFLTKNYQCLLANAIKRREECKSNCEFYTNCRGGCNNSALIAGDITKSGYQECQIYQKLNNKIAEILKGKLNGNLDNIPNLNPKIKKIKLYKGETKWN